MSDAGDGGAEAERAARIGGAAATSYAALLARLDLAPAGDVFRGDAGPGGGALFGGLVAAQCSVAAGRSVAPERSLHALHGFFLLPGRHGVPLDYQVERIRDGRSFSTRRVRALQDGKSIFEGQLGFKQPERGIAHQQPAPVPPPPEECPALESRRAAILGVPERKVLPMELRCADPIPLEPDPTREPRLRLWMRFLGEPPVDPVLRAALLVYASDRVLLSTASLPHGIWWKDGRASSLDHAVWIHGELGRQDLAGWLHYDCQSPVSRDALGLCLGAFYTPEGRRLASVAQQGVVRYPGRNRIRSPRGR